MSQIHLNVERSPSQHKSHFSPSVNLANIWPSSQPLDYSGSQSQSPHHSHATYSQNWSQGYSQGYSQSWSQPHSMDDEEEGFYRVDSDSQYYDADLAVLPKTDLSSGVEVFSVQGLMDRLQKDIEKVHEMFSIPTPIARALCSRFKWDVSKLSLEFLEKGRDKVLQDAGMSLPEEMSAGDRSMATDGEKFCPACQCESPADQFFALSCGHEFCSDCWQGFLVTAINNQNLSLMTCMQFKCKTPIDESTVAKFVDSASLSKYQERLLNSYVSDNPKMNFCPSVPSCGHVVYVENPKACYNVHCKCGLTFCLSCGTRDGRHEPHAPATCAMVQEFFEGFDDHGALAKYLQEHTKDCPKCNTPVEKAPGCSHMTCRCGHGFCWVCGQPCSGPHCELDRNLQVGVVEDGWNISKRKDKRVVFQGIVTDHYQLRKKHADVLVALRDKIQEVCDLNHLSLDDFVWIRTAAEKMDECRRVLQYSYCFTYYIFQEDADKNLPVKVAKKFTPERSEYVQAILAEKQKQLEEAVLKLSQMLNNTAEFIICHQDIVLRAAEHADLLCHSLFAHVREEIVADYDWGSLVPEFLPSVRLFTIPQTAPAQLS